MMIDTRPGGAWCLAREHNGDELWCLLSQMTWGVLVIWMAGVLQALIDGRWGYGWAGCGGVTGKRGLWQWSLKGVGTFGFVLQPFSFRVSIADSLLTDWVGEMRHGFIMLCVALGHFSLHIRWLMCLCCHLKLLFYSPAIFHFYDCDLLESIATPFHLNV